MDPIDFGGQRSKVKVTIDTYRNKHVNAIQTKPLGASLSNLADKRMDPVDYGDQRSKVNVIIDVYGNKLVNIIETKPLCASSLNLADILVIVRG